MDASTGELSQPPPCSSLPSQLQVHSAQPGQHLTLRGFLMDFQVGQMLLQPNFE